MVEHVLNDGIVRADEVRLVYKAVESVLPRDAALLDAHGLGNGRVQ